MAQKIQVEYEAKIDKLATDLKKLEVQQKRVGDQALKTGKILETEASKRSREIAEIRKDLAFQIMLRNQAFDPKTVKRFNAEISQTQDLLKKTVLGTKQLKQETVKINKSLNTFNSTLKNIGKSLAVAFSIGALIQFGKQLNRTAIQMEAFKRRAAIVFGDSIEFIKEFGRENALALGFTENEFLGATAAIGDLLIPLVANREEAARMSAQLLKVAAAQKQFAGDTRSVKEISDILTRSLTGQTVGLNSLQIRIDKTSEEFKDLVKSKIEDDGITKSQAKSLAIYEMILQQSSDAIVSFEEDTDSLGQAQAELGANIRTLTEELAILLTPALKVATEAILDQIEFINDSSSNLEKLTKILQFLSPVTTAATIANNLFNKSVEEQIDIIGANFLIANDLNNLTKEEIRNVFFLQKAIKELTEERKAQGTSVARVRQITLELIPIQKELDELLGKGKDRVEELEKEWKKLDRTLRQNIKEALRGTGSGLRELGDEFDAIMKDLEAFGQRIEEVNILAQLRFENIALQFELAGAGVANLEAIQTRATQARIDNLKELGLSQEEFQTQSERIREEGETTLRALFVFDQILAASQIIINLQKEIAGIAANPALTALPDAGVTIKTALIANARLRAAIGIATVTATTIAGLAEGEVDIQGGERGKDSIPAMIMPGESVIKTKATGKYKEELIAANNLNLESFINNKYVLPAIVKVRGEQAFAERWMQENAFDETGIVRQLKKPIKIENYRQMAKEIARQSSDYNYFHP